MYCHLQPLMMLTAPLLTVLLHASDSERSHCASLDTRVEQPLHAASAESISAPPCDYFGSLLEELMQDARYINYRMNTSTFSTADTVHPDAMLETSVATQRKLQTVSKQNSTQTDDTQFRQQLIEFYQTHHPSKLNDSAFIDTLVSTYKGIRTHVLLLEVLHRKYGVQHSSLATPSPNNNDVLLITEDSLSDRGSQSVRDSVTNRLYSSRKANRSRPALKLSTEELQLKQIQAKKLELQKLKQRNAQNVAKMRARARDDDPVFHANRSSKAIMLANIFASINKENERRSQHSDSHTRSYTYSGGNIKAIKQKSSASPTYFPTCTPSEAPTFSPTASPTTSPTPSPTPSPTAFPTASPTAMDHEQKRREAREKRLRYFGQQSLASTQQQQQPQASLERATAAAIRSDGRLAKETILKLVEQGVVSPKDLVPESTIKQQRVEWQWQDDNSRWNAYDEQVTARMEQLHAQNSTLQVDLNQFTYRITRTGENQGVQLNTETSKQRACRRVVVELTKRNPEFDRFMSELRAHSAFSALHASSTLYEAKSAFIEWPEQRVEQRFRRDLGDDDAVKFFAVERVLNPHHDAIYESILKSKCEQYGLPRERLEEYAWHGFESMDNLEPILSNGFDRVYSRNARYGKGTYFAVSADYSDGSGYVAKRGGYRHMLFCKVLVGRSVEGESGIRMKLFKNDQGEMTEYDSFVDDERRPTMYVAWRDFTAIPVYLIRYRKKND